MSTRPTLAIEIKRVYEPAVRTDGYRVLVDRLWPRGMAKENARIDAWLKEVAPSAELRRWFGHYPDRWPEFRKRYFDELRGHHELLRPLVERAQRGRVTLLFAAREERFNNAVALRSYLRTHRSLHGRVQLGAATKVGLRRARSEKPGS